MSKRIIHWFKQDLRLSDNPSFYQATKEGEVLPVYILDDVNPKKYTIGAASKWWLYHSLLSLNKSLQENLYVARGNPKKLLQKLIQDYKINAVYWNRCYEPWQIERDTKIEKYLKDLGIEVKSFNGSLLWEPTEILKKDNTPYLVFTAFYHRGCLGKNMRPRDILLKPEKIQYVKARVENTHVSKLNLIPQNEWYKKLSKYWKIGEEHAHKNLEKFIENGLSDYKEGRNYPAKNSVSRLSPHIHYGEISVNQIWFKIAREGDNVNTDCFLSELGWREFSYYLLYYFPKLPEDNLQKKFDKFPWNNNQEYLQKWRKGYDWLSSS